MGTLHWLFTADKPECAYVVVLHSHFSVACYSDAPSILLYVRQIVSYFKKPDDPLQKKKKKNFSKIVNVCFVCFCVGVRSILAHELTLSKNLI